MKYQSKVAVLTASIVLLLACQVQAKKPTPDPEPEGDPHTVQFVVDVDETTTCPVATSQGLTQVSDALVGFALDNVRTAGYDDFNFLVLESGNALRSAQASIHTKKGSVSGVTLFFGTAVPTGDPNNPWKGGGLHRTDQLSAYASVNADGVWTIHIHANCVEVWKEKGPGKGTVIGEVSVGDIVYSPVIDNT